MATPLATQAMPVIQAFPQAAPIRKREILGLSVMGFVVALFVIFFVLPVILGLLWFIFGKPADAAKAAEQEIVAIKAVSVDGTSKIITPTPVVKPAPTPAPEPAPEPAPVVAPPVVTPPVVVPPMVPQPTQIPILGAPAVVTGPSDAELAAQAQAEADKAAKAAAAMAAEAEAKAKAEGDKASAEAAKAAAEAAAKAEADAKIATAAAEAATKAAEVEKAKSAPIPLKPDGIPNVCPSGKTLIDGLCYTNKNKCPDGRELKGALCYLPEKDRCPSGKMLIDGLCYTNKNKCPDSNRELKGALCYLPEKDRCPSGKMLIDGLCYTQKNKCPAGRDLKGALCYLPEKDRCPTGKTLIDGLCYASSTKCPPGRTLKGLFCYLPSPCPSGMDQSGLFCYPKAGKCTNNAPAVKYVDGLCYENDSKCASGKTKIGALCYDTKTGCDGDKELKGALCYGKAPCEPGKNLEGGMCYTPCQAGYKGVGPVCWSGCPSGFTDTGVSCNKPGSYGRGGGYPWKFGDKLGSLDAARARCSKANPQGCEKDGQIIYPRCRSGFHKVGCCVCSPDCPGGMTDTGVACAKKSYGRGVGTPDLTKLGTPMSKSYPLAMGTVPKGMPIDAGVGMEVGTIPIDIGKPLELGSMPTDLGKPLELGSMPTDLGKPLELGSIPTECKSGNIKVGALCYKPCDSGYSQSGLFCVKNTEFMSNGGILVLKKKPKTGIAGILYKRENFINSQYVEHFIIPPRTKKIYGIMRCGRVVQLA